LCSLTKTAAQEIANKAKADDLPLSRSDVGTLHAHCYRALDRPEIAEAHIDEWSKANPDLALDALDEPDLDEPSFEHKPESGTALDSSNYQRLRAAMVPRSSWPSRTLAFAQAWEKWKKDSKLMDFTDLIDVCLHDGVSAPGKPRYLMVDEAQDLSALEYMLVKSWGEKCKADFMVGDPRQSLYAWRGAHPELFHDPSVSADHVKVLAQSHRVPRQLHAAAESWATRLSDWKPVDYRPTDQEGVIVRATSTWSEPELIARTAEKLADSGSRVIVMASCGFMIEPIVALLRRRGVPFSNPWRVKRGDWNLMRGGEGSTASRVRAFLKVSQGEDWTLGDFAKWSGLILAKGTLIRGSRDEIEAESKIAPQDMLTVEDMTRWIEPDALSDLREAGTYLDALDWLEERLLSAKAKSAKVITSVVRAKGMKALTDSPMLHVGTIHSFKGAECDHAFVFPDLSPAGLREWSAGGHDRDGVIRMFYVALTRARSSLHIARSAKFSPIQLSEER
jgi:superfamily I DNA/RNA helicase